MPTKSKLEEDINVLVTVLDEKTVDDYNILHFELTMEERDLIVDALVFYKEMNTY